MPRAVQAIQRARFATLLEYISDRDLVSRTIEINLIGDKTRNHRLAGSALRSFAYCSGKIQPDSAHSFAERGLKLLSPSNIQCEAAAFRHFPNLLIISEGQRARQRRLHVIFEKLECQPFLKMKCK